VLRWGPSGRICGNCQSRLIYSDPEVIVDFDTLFKTATLQEPYPYQRVIAVQGFPEVIEAPTGAGKTEAVVLGWLFRRHFHPDPLVQESTPRRLIIAQPMRTLVEQTHDRVHAILDRLELADEVTLHVMMGGHLKPEVWNAWRAELHKPAIVIATVDCVVSRALNRGYGTSRAGYPIDFALVTNGALVVLDEIQLAPQAAATQRQLIAFQRNWGTAEPADLVCMSATIDPTALNVVDNPWSGDPARIVRISEADKTGPLRTRLEAVKTVTKLPVTTPAALASEVSQRHRGGLSIVVVNTVETAVTTYKALRRLKPDAELMLLHSRFRGVERADLAVRLTAEHGSRIIVSTQVIEAGVDLSASLLVTEVAPWSSLVQRAGRCNRKGEQPDAVLAWFDSIGRGPYQQADLDATAATLASLEGQHVTPASLGTLTVAQSTPELRFIRRRDLESLFDTTPDLAGRDVDVSRYIRPDEQLDLQVAWIDIEGSGPSTQTPLPPEPLRCAVPLGAAVKFLGRAEPPRAWVFDAFGDRWRPFAKGLPLAPQQVILVDAASGGYSVEAGFDPTSNVPVPPRMLPVKGAEDESAGTEAGTQTGQWEALRAHLAEAGDQADRLVRALRPDLPESATRCVVAAAALHDVGKAHADWQAALVEGAEPPPEANLLPVAKSPTRARLIVRRGKKGTQPRRAFRHELVSALLLDTDAGPVWMRDQGLTDAEFALCRYLVAAHHGRIRLQPRDPMAEGRDGSTIHGLVDGEPLLGGAHDGATDPVVDLSPFRGGVGSWSAMALQLLEEFGPFRLAYLETLVRMADWRASGHLPLAEEPS
jgi:CRISPR-associated endonuclease/helicase Cas3